ncbi:MAG: ion channel [Clostridium sp.]
MKKNRKRILIVADSVVNLKEFKEIKDLSFKAIKYVECVFVNIEFQNIRLENVIFEECTFKFCSFTNCSIANNSLLGIYNGEIINTDFVNCNLKNLVIRKTNLKKVTFKDVYLGRCNFVKNSYEKVKFIDGCNLSDCVIKGNRARFDVEFINNDKKGTLTLTSYVGGFNYKISEILKRESEEIYKEIANSYLSFANQYLKNDLGDKYGYCFYQSKKAIHKTFKGFMRLKSFLSYWICGYGEKPFRAFGFSLLIVLLCAFIYIFSGVQADGKVIQYSLGNVIEGNILKDLAYCFHFSLVTFATVGYGNIIPVGMVSIIISNIEIMLGVLMIGIWTSTIVRKMTR